MSSHFLLFKIAVNDFVKNFKETRSGELRKGSGRIVSATTEQIADDSDLLVSLQEENLRADFSMRKIAPKVK